MIMKICRFQQILPGFEHSSDGCSHMDTAGLTKLLHGRHRFHGDAFGFTQVSYWTRNMCICILSDQDSCGLIPGNGLLGLFHTDNNRRAVFYVCEKHLTPPKDILPLCDTVVL